MATAPTTVAAAVPKAAAGDGTPALDRGAFKRVVKVPALRVPKQRCNELMKTFRGFTLDKPKTRCVVLDSAGPDTRLLLLREDLEGAAALPPELQTIITNSSFDWSTFDLEFDYKHLTADQVLRQLLPAGVEVPSSFESIGHIAHLNLKEDVLPYKNIIGQVIMDKNPHISTVVNKLGTIENEYRVFDMEVIAGREDFETEVVQHGLRFRLDFSKVYWNSRLETEHNRLVSLFEPDDVIADIMAGIGPFAVPAGMRGCKVYANDLNPTSAHYLAANVGVNRLAGRVLPFNMDGREFVRLLLATPGGPADSLQPPLEAPEAVAAAAGGGAAEKTGEQQQQQKQQKRQKRAGAEPGAPAGPPPPSPPGFRPPPGGVLFDHAVMNLPASAVEFLDSFRGAFNPGAWRGRPLPLVHCYTFMKDEGEQGVVARVEAALGGCLEGPPSIHNVRDVAPNKTMLCVSFRVPAAVAFAGRLDGQQQQQQQQQEQQQQRGEGPEEQQNEQEQEQAAKKPRLAPQETP